MSRGSMRFEDDLRKIRLSKGLDFDSIYKKTKIRPEVIDRLETTGLADDPVFSTDIYKRPLIRNYAHGLGINPEEVLRAFDMAENGEYDGFLGQKYVDPDWKPEPKKRPKADVSDVMDKWYPNSGEVGAAVGATEAKKSVTKKKSPTRKSSAQSKTAAKKTSAKKSTPKKTTAKKASTRKSTLKTKVKKTPTAAKNGKGLKGEENLSMKKPSEAGNKKSEKSPYQKAKKATHDYPKAPPQNNSQGKNESKPNNRVMEKNDHLGDGTKPSSEKERSLRDNHERLKPNPRRVSESPHSAPNYEPSAANQKSKMRYLVPIAAILAGITIGGFFGPGLIAKFSDKQPVTIKYSQSSSFDEMPSLMKGVVETGDNEKTFVIIALRKDVTGRNDQFNYTLRTTTNGQLYSVNGTGQISPDRNRISIGDYGWGSIKKAPDGQFAIISVNETDYPRWELTGK